MGVRLSLANQFVLTAFHGSPGHNSQCPEDVQMSNCSSLSTQAAFGTSIAGGSDGGCLKSVIIGYL